MHALEQPLVLELVLQYAGPDQWLFLGAISKTWAAMHEAVPHEQHRRRRAAMREHGKTTSFAAASASMNRALYACACDVNFVKDKLLPLSKAAAASGRTDVLLWAKATAASKWIEWHQQLCLSAAACSQLATLQWLLAQSEEPVAAVQIATEAAKHADLAMLQWACNLQPNWTEKDVEAVACGAAAADDAIEKLDWLRVHFPEHQLATPDVAFSSICIGAVQSLQWLAAQGLALQTEQYTGVAAHNGQFGVLQYLIETLGCPWNAVKVRDAAAKLGSAEDLQWLREADAAIWNTAVLSRLLIVAGLNDNVPTAKWLRAAGAEWPTSFLTRVSAIKVVCWPLRTMQWARASGCPWGTWRSFDCTNYCGHADVTLTVFDAKPWKYWAHTTDPRVLDVYDAMLWAHAAGCPCSNWLHHMLARVKYRYACSEANNSSSSSSSSSSSNSSSSSMCSSCTPQRWRCDLVLFQEFFSFNCPFKPKLYLLGPPTVCIWLATKLAIMFASSAEAAVSARKRGESSYAVVYYISLLWIAPKLYFGVKMLVNMHWS
jgi:hypothetical protein